MSITMDLNNLPKYQAFNYSDKPKGRNYFSIPAASASLLKKFLDWCPNKAINNVFDGTKSTREGTLIHAVVLEPHTIHEEYIQLPPESIKAPKESKAKKKKTDEIEEIIPEIDTSIADYPFSDAPLLPQQELIKGHYYLFEGIRKGKSWEAQRDFALENKVELISKTELENAKLAANEVLKHKVSRQFFDNPHITEEEFFYDVKADNEEIINCKLKADMLVNIDGRLVIVDLKTIEDASMVGINKNIDKYHYDLQASAYLNGVSLNKEQAKVLNLPIGTKAEQFVFIFIEKGNLPVVNVCKTSAETNLLGFLKYKKAIDIYADCILKGFFPGYVENESTTLELTSWQRKKLVELSIGVDPNDLPLIYQDVFLQAQEAPQLVGGWEQPELDEDDVCIDLESI